MNDKPYILKDNRFDDGSPVASATAAGYDIDSLFDLKTYTIWKGNGTSDHTITVDCGSAKTSNGLGIAGLHNLFTCGANISIECSDDNFVADTTVALAAFTVSSDNSVIFKKYTAVSKRYWRIKFTSLSAAPELAMLILGALFEFPRWVQSNYSPFVETIHSNTVRSNVHTLGTAIDYYEKKMDPQFKNLDPTWVKNTFEPLWAYIKQLKPFFWVWNLTGRADEVYLVKLPDGFSLSLPYDPIRQSIKLSFIDVSGL